MLANDGDLSQDSQASFHLPATHRSGPCIQRGKQPATSHEAICDENCEPTNQLSIVGSRWHRVGIVPERLRSIRKFLNPGSQDGAVLHSHDLMLGPLAFRCIQAILADGDRKPREGRLRDDDRS